MNRLGYRHRQTLRLESRKRRIKDRLGAPKMTKQFPGHARTQSGRQRKRQPSQVLVGIHRRGACGSLRSRERDCQER
jgi:hypothetical protein